MDSNYTSSYNRGVRGVNDDFAAKRTANTFSRGLSQRRGSRQMGDATRSFRRQVPSMQQNFAGRGIANSGVYKRAMQNFTGDYTRNLGRMQEDLDSAGYQFDLQDRQLVAERDRVLQEMELAKAQQIAMTAQHIQGLKPYMG